MRKHICGLFSCTFYRFFSVFRSLQGGSLAQQKVILQSLLFAVPCGWLVGFFALRSRSSFCGFFSATFFFEFSRLLLYNAVNSPPFFAFPPFFSLCVQIFRAFHFLQCYLIFSCPRGFYLTDLGFYFVIFAFGFYMACQLFYNKRGGERKQQLIWAKNVNALAKKV